ncbi:helix-turn-helix domain-containing protein [Arthrobacter halodurans]|uniref:Helix-turn-helix domain-containing protein n=1 Tax=Arthrobacter halodurans TaxID=516699 RepID=A0ABV4UTK2_9MICC
MPRRRQQDAALLAHCRIDGLLAARDMTLKDLGKRIGVSLSVLKNSHAQAIWL